MNLRVYKCGFFWKSGVFVGGLGGVGTWILVAHGLTRIRHGFKRFFMEKRIFIKKIEKSVSNPC